MLLKVGFSLNKEYPRMYLVFFDVSSPFLGALGCEMQCPISRKNFARLAGSFRKEASERKNAVVG